MAEILARVAPLTSWRRRLDLRLIAAAAALGALLLVFSEIADMIDEPGEIPWLDRAVLSALRTGPDGTDPLGPPVVEKLVVDLTALGSGAVAAVFAACVVGFLVIERRWGFALVVVVSIAGAWLWISILKNAFERPRPSLVAPMLDPGGLSFPSGHALQAATLYSTLGVLLASAVRSRRTKAYVVACAVTLTIVIGLTRVYLGVHYPTDVLAGWAIGFSWALACGIALHALRRRRVVKTEAPVEPSAEGPATSE